MSVRTSDVPDASAAVRAAAADDVVPIHALAVDNAMFAPDDIAGFAEMLQGYLDGSLDRHRWIVADDAAGRVVGAAYYAPEPFADRLWNLYFLAVHPGEHRKGIGTLLTSHVEESLRTAGSQVARVLIVETSSTDEYWSARSSTSAKALTARLVSESSTVQAITRSSTGSRSWRRIAEQPPQRVTVSRRSRSQLRPLAG